VPWVKRHQLILEKKGLPASDDKMQMFLNASSVLTSAGYKPVGLDHFVLPEDELYIALNEHKLHRNFQGYCTRRTTGQVYAFGVTGISQLEKGYSQNTKDIDRYISMVQQGTLPVEKGYILNRRQIYTREVITGIMCNRKISFEDIAGTLGITAGELKQNAGYSEKALEELANDGLVKFNEDEVEVTETGSLFIRNIAASFDIDYISKVQNTYSKPV
jgi:oxygen-independent coproporphyrinogen-3 oxidase